MNIKIIVNDANNEVKTYSDAINFAGNKLVEKNYVDSKYINACINREKKFPTGLLLSSGKGIAIPHGDSDLVKQNGISVVRTLHEIEFGRMEDVSQKVHCKLLFNLALASGQEHITVLRKLVGFFQDEEFLDACQTLNEVNAAEYIAKKLEN